MAADYLLVRGRDPARLGTPNPVWGISPPTLLEEGWELRYYPAMPYLPILATLAYVLSADGKRVLLIHRNRRPDDAHFGKYNGLGGKMERTESPVACIRRELMEEAAIQCTKICLKGTISWPGFGKGGEDWFGFIFRVEGFTGTPPAENAEGTLSWVPVETVATLPLWEGDRHFLPLVFGSDPRQFHGVMPYEGGRPLSWTFDWI